MRFWISFHCTETRLNIRDDINVLFVEGKNNCKSMLLSLNVNKYPSIFYFGNFKKIQKSI